MLLILGTKPSGWICGTFWFGLPGARKNANEVMSRSLNMPKPYSVARSPSGTSALSEKPQCSTSGSP